MKLTKRHLVALGLVVALLPVLYSLVMKTALGPFTTNPSDYSGAGSPTGPFEVNFTLSEPPALDKTVTVVISARNRADRTWPNTAIRLTLFKRTSPYEYNKGHIVWEKMNQIGDMGPYDTRTVTMEMKVDEPGLYILMAYAGTFNLPGYIMGNDVTFYLNVTENATRVGRFGEMLEPQSPPPPPNPYFVKMELDGVPALNRPVNLRVTIASLMDVKNATFKIFLPEGIELVSGDLMWNGNFQRATNEEIGELTGPVDKFPEKALARIPESKKVRMRATIKAKLVGNVRIVVFPAQELPPEINCYVNVFTLGIPHPEGPGWLGVSRGGCLNVRVFNETDAIFSERVLPEQPLPPRPANVPIEPSPKTPPPGLRFQTPGG